MKVLVTGGAGFIGRVTCLTLPFYGHTPVVFDRYRHDGIDMILGDVTDPVAVSFAVAQCDAVIHLAGVLGTQETVQNPVPAFRTNVLGALNVFEAVAEHKVPAVNICVGNHFMDNPYAISKASTERMAQFYNNERGTRIANVRAYNAYGGTQTFPAPWGPSKIRKILPTMVASVLNDQPIVVYGDGEQIMDMVYVNDVAEVLVQALELGPGERTYEAGTGVHTTVNDIANMVIKTLGKGEIEHVPMRPGEPHGAVVVADTSTLLGFDVDFLHPEQGIPIVADHYRKVWRE